MRRATSKKRAAEAEKELDMDNKEATPVEDMEKTLEPVSYTHLITVNYRSNDSPRLHQTMST